MNEVRIVVVTAGLSEPSSTALLGERLAASTLSGLEGTGLAPIVETISLRGLAHGIADYMTMGFPSGDVGRALDSVRSADAVIAVTPTFKASYTGLFKSFWDLTADDDLASIPTIVAATGGTARHSLVIESALRPLFAYLHADVVPTGVFAATDDFGADSSLQHRIDRAGNELADRLAWRSDTARPEPTEEEAQAPSLTDGSGLPPLTVTPFEELLKG